MLSFLKGRQAQKQIDHARLISPYVKEEYYLKCGRADIPLNMTPAMHYLVHGWREGRNPSPDFHTDFYLESHPDVRDAGLHPLVHYVLNGKAEGRIPAPVGYAPLADAVIVAHLMDADHYRSQLPDGGQGIDDLALHFVDRGWRLYDLVPWFSSRKAIGQHTLAHFGCRSPLLYFMLGYGLPEGPMDTATAAAFAERVRRDRALIAEHFEEDFYRLTGGGMVDTPEDAIARYMVGEWRVGPDIAAWFDSRTYAGTCGGAKRGETPLTHYLTVGRDRGLSAPLPKLPTTVQLAVLAESGMAAHYLATQDDIRNGKLDPLEHYLFYGWRENRQPVRWFDGEYYIRTYPEVAANDWCPFIHYLLIGHRRGWLPMQPLDPVTAEALNRAGIADGAWIKNFRAADYIALNNLEDRGFTPETALLHFITEGIDRAAPISLQHAFDPAFYRSFYSDLGLTDDRAAARHWYSRGYLEGRFGAPRQFFASWSITTQALPQQFLDALAADGDLPGQGPWQKLDVFLKAPDQGGKTADGFLSPAFAPILHHILSALVGLGRLDAAQILMARLAQAGIDGLEIREQQAHIQIAKQDWAAAIVTLTAKTETMGGGDLSAKGRSLLCQAYLGAGQWDALIDFAGKVLEKHPADLDVQSAYTQAIVARFDYGLGQARRLGQDEPSRQACVETVEACCSDLVQALRAGEARRHPLRLNAIRTVAIYTDCTLHQCNFYRVDQKVQHLAGAGIAATVFRGGEGMEALARRRMAFDAVIFYRIGANPNTVNLVRQIREAGTVTFYEIDDLIFDPAEFPDTFASYGGQIDRDIYASLVVGTAQVQAVMALCDYGIASTPPLAREMARHIPGKVFVHRNAMGKEHVSMAGLVSRSARQRPVTLFYGTGTKAHNAEFDEILAPALERIFKKRGAEVRLLVAGYLTLPARLAPFRDHITLVEPIWDYQKYWALLRDECDINLAVLKDSLMTGCKSEIKWLEAAQFGIPSVVSATETLRAVVEHGRDGLLAATVDEWVIALDRLIGDADLRFDIGRRAHAKVWEAYAPASMSRNLESIFAEVIAQLTPPAPAGDVSPGKIRVAMVGVFYPPIRVGGATRVLEDNVRDLLALHGDQIEIEVFSTIPADRSRVLAESNLPSMGWMLPVDGTFTTYCDGVRVTYLGTDWAETGENRLENPGAKQAFADFLARYRPDFVHFHCIQRLTTDVVFATQDAGIPYFVTVHDGWWLSPFQFLVNDDLQEVYYNKADDLGALQRLGLNEYQRSRSLKLALDRAERIFAVSRSFAALYARHGYPAISLPNGVSPLKPRARQPASGHRLRLGFIGGMSPHKGYVVLQYALHGARYDNLELFVVDDSVIKGTEVRAVWGNTPVTFIPRTPADDIESLYAQLDVVLVPSVWPESFGLVVREAQDMGLWVVVSDMGALPEDVEDGRNGFVFPAGDHHALQRILAKLDADPATYRNGITTKPALRHSVDQARQLASHYLGWRTLPSSFGPEAGNVIPVSGFPYLFRRPDRAAARVPQTVSDVLHAVVGGFEHSGTTMVSEILRQHPDLDSSFEGGFLLNDSPRQFPTTQPFFNNLCDTWKLTPEQVVAITDTDSFAEAYQRLREASPVIVDKTVKLFDKTPRYMQHMSRVLELVDVPGLCMVRDPRAVFWSSYRRTKLSIEEWHKTVFPVTVHHTRRYCRGARRAVEQFGPQRFMLVQYEELCLNQRETTKKICQHLGLEYCDSMLQFSGKRFDLVYSTTIQTDYINEYRSKLPLPIQHEIEDLFSDFSDWMVNI